MTLKVALVALTVRGAMGQYVQALSCELAREAELHLFVPEHFDGLPQEATSISRFATGKRRIASMIRLLSPLAALKVWKKIRAIRPSVIHVFNGEGYPWTLMWASMASHDNLPLLVTVHDPEPHPGNIWEWLNARLRTWVLKRATSIHIHSSVFTDVVRAQGARDICIIPHGSLAPRFLQYTKSNIRREPIALFFGRLEKYKGLDILVKAGILLDGKLRIIIAGPGRVPRDLAREINHYSAIFELHNRYLDDSEVAELFQRAAVCVLPYRQASQSSIPLISAAFGVPVVATAVGAFVEDIPKINGLLVPPEDARALSQAMIMALGRAPICPADLEFPIIANLFAEWYKHNAN